MNFALQRDSARKMGTDHSVPGAKLLRAKTPLLDASGRSSLSPFFALFTRVPVPIDDKK